MSNVSSNKYLSNPSNDFLTKIYPTIAKNFASHSNSHQTDIRKYIDNNNEVLFSSGPHYRLYFNDDERDKVFNHIGMRRIEVNDIINKCEVVDSTWMLTKGKPFHIVMPLIIRYYMLKKEKKQMENSILYLALSIYSSLHARQFKYPPNTNVMDYTINNLNNKYKLKQFGTLLAAIKDIAVNCHTTYTDYLNRGTDVLLNTYVMALHTRLSGFIVKISQEYYKNYQEGNYLNTEEDDYSEENYHVVENDSFIINKLTYNVTTKIITKGIDYKICKISANMCQVSVNSLQKTLQDIVYQKDKEIGTLVNLILQLYLNDNTNSTESIGSKKFVEYCLQIYIKSNTKDKNIIQIKELLDNWLSESSDLYLKTNRAATKNNLRKAVYLYIVFSIQQESINV